MGLKGKFKEYTCSNIPINSDYYWHQTNVCIHFRTCYGDEVDSPYTYHGSGTTSLHDQVDSTDPVSLSLWLI